jgi:flagellar hook-basal body complex protein FliE
MLPLLPAIAGAALSDLQGLVGDVATGISGDTAIGGVKGHASFVDTLKTALDRVNDQISTASGAAASYAAGDHAIPLSSVMVSLEKANLAFQTAATVRDRVTEAYNTVMNMQV